MNQHHQQHDNDEVDDTPPFESIMNKWWGWRNETLLYTSCGKRIVKFNKGYAIRSPLSIMGYIDLVNPSYLWTRSSSYFRDCLASLEWIECKYGIVRKRRKLLGLF